jgi:hypothetical protein
MKNRKREICTSGTVRDEDGNILIYSAAASRRKALRSRPCRVHIGAKRAINPYSVRLLTAAKTAAKLSQLKAAAKWRFPWPGICSSARIANTGS